MITLFVSCCILIGTLFLYRRDLQVAIPRSLALIILYLIITGFTVPLKRKTNQSAPILLIDVSQSMESHFRNIQLEIATLNFDYVPVYFSETLYVQSPDSLEEFGTYTDIIGALLSFSDLHPSSIILLSDGNHNYDGTTLAHLDECNVPVYTFGIGTADNRDVQLLEILHPDYVYTGDSIYIHAVVQSYGYDEGMATIELEIGHAGKKMRRSFPLSKTKAKSTITFPVRFEQPQDSMLIVTVLPSPGEAHTNNNTQTGWFTPVTSKIPIVYYTDHLSFNTKFIIQSLMLDTRLEIKRIARSFFGDHTDPISGSPLSIPTLDSINVLIVDNITCTTLPWKNVPDAVRKGLGILCLGTIQDQPAAWQDMLPITVANKVIQGNFPLQIEDSFSCLIPDKTYPPFTQMQRVLSVKEGAVIIARSSTTPIIAYQRYGQGTVFQVNSVDIGRWHFIQKGLQQKDMLSSLLPDIIRFISPEGRNKRLILSSARGIYTPGEHIELTLKSYDPNFRASGGGDFSVTHAERTIPFFEIEKGVYRTSFPVNHPGKITLIATGVLNNESLTSNTKSIQVKEGSLEHITELNPEFLKSITQRTGGRYNPIDSLTTFTEPVRPAVYQTTHIELNNPFSYLLLLVFLVGDWIIRRRRGMV